MMNFGRTRGAASDSAELYGSADRAKSMPDDVFRTESVEGRRARHDY